MFFSGNRHSKRASEEKLLVRFVTARGAVAIRLGQVGWLGSRWSMNSFNSKGKLQSPEVRIRGRELPRSQFREIEDTRNPLVCQKLTFNRKKKSQPSYTASAGEDHLLWLSLDHSQCLLPRPPSFAGGCWLLLQFQSITYPTDP